MTHPPTPELRSPHPRSAFPTPPAAVEAGPKADDSGTANPAADPFYSIRFATDAGAPCARCGEATGSGPVGYHGDQAICDLCLLEGSHELGMVLALVAVTRAYGSVEDPSSEEQRQGLRILGAFARIYESFAAKAGPARRIVPHLPIN